MRRLGLVVFLVLMHCEGVVMAPHGSRADGRNDLVPPAPSPSPNDSGTVTPAGDAGATDAGATPTPPDAGAPTPDAGGPPNPCATITCAANAHCLAGSCLCDLGFAGDGTTCVAMDPGVPALRSQAQMCLGWQLGQSTRDAQPFTKSNATCDKGTLSRGGIEDAVARLAAYRYLAGLAPAAESSPQSDEAQACALISAWNPAGVQAHAPPPSSTCYSAAGAGAAGSSNIAWGCGSPAGAIDLWIQDPGNETTYGHRRWLLNPSLGPVGMGYYEGGNNYGSAACIEVFGSSGQGPRPSFIPWPSPGFQPLEVTQMTWTVQGDIPLADAQALITDSHGGQLDAGVEVLSGNYGFTQAVRIDRQGWDPKVGETYHVILSGQGHAPVEWELKPVTCP